MQIPADTELVEMVNRGNLEAFAELYLRHKDWVYRYVISRVANREIAVDLVQDIFTRALQGLFRLQPGLNFGAWLNGITRHVVIDYLRREGRRKEMVDLETEGPVDPASFEETIYSGELMGQILAALNPEQRAIINLRLVEGHSTNEVAVLLHGQDNEENRRKVILSLYRALKAARQVAEKIMQQTGA